MIWSNLTASSTQNNTWKRQKKTNKQTKIKTVWLLNTQQQNNWSIFRTKKKGSSINKTIYRNDTKKEERRGLVIQMFEIRSWRGVLDTTLCDKVCQWLATGRWFSPGTPVSPRNKTDRHDITEILLNVALSIINQPNHRNVVIYIYICENAGINQRTTDFCIIN